MTIADMLYGYQEEAVQKIVSSRRQAIFDEPGLGKTITVLGALERDGAFETPYRVLVLATTTGAALTWYPTCQRLLDDGVQVIPAFKGLLATRRKKALTAATAEKPTIVIGNHAFIELSKAQTKTPDPMFEVEWDAIIIDESQRVLPTKANDDANFTAFWRGLTRLKTTGRAFRIPMSGTPDRGKLENRYGTWKFVLPEKYNAALPYDVWMSQMFRLRFRKRYITVRGKPFEIIEPIPLGLKNAAAWAVIDDVLSIRRTKGEVAAWLPPKRYIDIEVQLPPKLKKAYEAYQEEFSKTGDDGTPDDADKFRVRATQFAICEWDIKKVGFGTKGTPIVGSESWKRDWLIEWLQEREYDLADSTDTSKVVITSQFSRVLRWLSEELGLRGIPSSVLDGSLTTNQRLAVQKDFQGGPARIILLNMSLGDSIDLDAADDLIFVDLVNDPDKTTQTEDRVHRVSRNHNVTIWRLITLGTVDEAILRSNNGRFDVTRQSLDGRRGIEFARKILARIRV